MKRKQEKERYDRLSFKTRDRQFQQEAIEGLSCSPLEAKALTEIVKEVYFPLLEEKSIENISKPLVTRYQELFERDKEEALHTRIREMESFLKKIANGSI